MFKYTKKLFGHGVTLLIIAVLAFANWYWPFYIWLGDTIIYRFIWLGIFFILLDICLEIITRSIKELQLMGEMVGFSRDIKKFSATFHLLQKVSLPNNVKVDYVVVGSSGVWLIGVQDNGGVVTFNGDDLTQNGIILKGLLTQLVEKSYALAEFLKKNLGKDLKVTPVAAFSSSKVNLDSVPKMVRGVYISSRKNIISLVEDTDIQLVDNNTIEEVFKLLKK